MELGGVNVGSGDFDYHPMRLEIAVYYTRNNDSNLYSYLYPNNK